MFLFDTIWYYFYGEPSVEKNNYTNVLADIKEQKYKLTPPKNTHNVHKDEFTQALKAAFSKKFGNANDYM